MIRVATPSPTLDALAALHGDMPVLPVSFAQMRFYVLDQLDEGATYTIPVALRLRGTLDAGALERALLTVAERHEALRTVFVMDGPEPVQVVLSAARVPFELKDLRALDAAAREAAVAEHATANANAPFDLAAGPLLRAALLRLADDEHVLLLAMHHIVSDGWSVGVLFEELEQAYGALAAGGPAALPALPLQYPDFAVWQRRAMEGTAAARQLAYWTDRLRDLPTLDLGTDRPRPPIQSAAGDKREVTIPAAVADAVRAIGRREGATAYMTFLAAFVALLHRYSGQTDLVVGSITSGRRRPEVEALIGLFVNTLAIRVGAEGTMSFAELLRAVRDRASEAYANQDVPFEHVVDAVQPMRDRSRSPVFQVAFQMFEGLAREPRLPGLAASRVPGVKATTKFDLTLMLHASAGGGLRAVMEYATALWDAATVDRMLAHYAALLAAIAREPGAPIGKLRLLDAAEDAAVTARWNDTAAPLPAWTTPARVLARAAAHPDRVAVRVDDDTLTYGALARASNALARRLTSAGVRPGDSVGVCMERTASLVVALLAVHRAGAAYVPLDPAYPADRVAHVLADAGVRAVLVDAATAARLPGTDAPVITVSRTDAGDETGAFDAPPADAESPAYVIYTSGSTGTPKGVRIPHRALSNFLASMAERPGMDEDDAVVAVTTIAFDIAGLELWLPLVNGAEVVLAPRAVATDGVALRALIERTTARIGGRTMVQATPATWTLLLAAGWAGDPRAVMLCGGEAWPAGLAEALLRRGAALWNVYGPTETTIWSARHLVSDARDVPLGEPLANTSLLVLEPSGEPAPLGVPGELWIGGAGLALGYHGRPDLTAERFVQHSRFGRIYRTGDRVRRRGDGGLQYLGRLDDQIKLRGFRNELGEIESVLAAQPGVSRAVAAVRTDGGEPRLVAYVVPAEGAARDAQAMASFRETLRRALPDYMVPAVVVPLDELPLTPNGKVNRRALPAPAEDAEPGVAYVAPRTPMESAVVGAWSDVLGRQRIGVNDGFFALGGNSLGATRVAVRLGQLVGVAVPVRALFEASTPAALAAWIDAQVAAAAADELADILSELDSLSDEEARALLEGEGGTS
jgi:amino acid adenylation domain-containing protein